MANASREVVTLQLGHYSNFVGTHWWNLQDAALCYDGEPNDSYSEINSNVLFREGVTLQGQPTYTPRLILMDLKGSLSSLKQEGSLYGVSQTEPALTWKGSLSVHKEDPAVKNQFLQQLDRLGDELNSNSRAFQGEERAAAVPGAERAHNLSQSSYRLEDSVGVWSDFLRVHLHPKTISVIQQYNHSSTSDRFEAFGFGEKLVRDPLFLDDFEDRLHFYIEECDYLQGFHILCDLHDSFAGLSAKVVELLNDEYGGKGILTCGFSPASFTDTSPVTEVHRLLNSFMGIVQLSSRSSIFCPMSLNRNALGRKRPSPVNFPHIIYDASLSYHSSAVLATALETLTIPYRLHSCGISLSQLTDALNLAGRKVISASASIPFPIRDTDTIPDVLCRQQAAMLWTRLTPCGDFQESQCFAQSVVIRGVSNERQISNLPPGVRVPSVLHSCPTGEDVLSTFLHSYFPTALSAVHLAQTPCSVTSPYPQFFSPSLNKQGQLLGDGLSSSSSTCAVQSIPVMSTLQSSPVLHSVLRSLYQEVNSLNLRKFSAFLSAGTDLEDVREVLEELNTLAHCYKINFDMEESGDDSDGE
ncbi:protein misato homolog 1 [Hemiscyllium ocellatum]|uniref:protein misato homolog 1 n=1 Tax=Hemiscyllium ocellatum TaxID=170820 RepID=UPI002966F9C1|nr:protein misato homolog 1 [Hemiscyllium ocellatum]